MDKAEEGEDLIGVRELEAEQGADDQGDDGEDVGHGWDVPLGDVGR
jgi:hypothetical protein